MKSYLTQSYIYIICFCLASCASLPKEAQNWQAYHQEKLDFYSSGRLSIQQNEHGSHGNYNWENSTGTVSLISILTPLGNTIGKLCKDKQGIVITDMAGRKYTGNSSTELSKQLLGYAIPLDYLDLWLNGYYSPLIPFQIQNQTLIQDGWKITLTRNEQKLPKKLFLTNENLTIQIVSDEYNTTSSKLNQTICQR